MNAYRTSPKHRAIARTIATIWALGVLAPPSFAATDLADIPMAVNNAVKPNIMFILDNSGSMEWGSITGRDALNEYSRNQTEFYSNAFNQLYYDPQTRYLPGINATSFTATNIEGTPLANATPSAAINNPYLAPGGTTTDLTGSCYYQGATIPIIPTVGGNCRLTITGGFTQGPVAITAYYYDYTGPANPDYAMLQVDANFTRRDILPSATYTRGANRTDCAVTSGVATCSYTQEMQNFANWWSYYRTRILTMKTTMGLSFASLSDKYRMGFSTINNNSSTGNANGANFISIGDFDYNKKIAWFTQLYAIDPQNGTPLQRALSRVGTYYKGSGMGYSGGVGADDPVQYSCQHNYAILSTDGFWNSNDVTHVGNSDTTVPTLPTALPSWATPPLTSGSSFPRPFFDYYGTSNTVADVAMYYWVNDLRPSLPNNVSTSNADPASWQHMTTFTIGLGADGSKDFREDYLTATTNNWFYNQLIAGTDNWPAAVADTNTAIDDLWHAAVNGRGQYFNAKNPTVLRRALKGTLDDIIARSGSAAAVAVANTDVSIDNTSYASSYNSGDWSGQLASYPIAADGTVSPIPTWTAQAQLDALTPNSRKIVTYSGTGGVQFQPYSATPPTATTITSAQQTELNSAISPPGPSDGTDVLNYIRGDRSGESGGSGVYRTRAHLLGDIVNGEPVVVTTPAYSYGDAGYTAFKAAQSIVATSTPLFTPTRIKTVFQGSNDGVVHAFDAATGAENWAYIPSFLLSSSAPWPLRNLAKKEFVRHPLLDATPAVGDADFNNTSSVMPSSPYVSDWRTLLIGGMGKGGRGYFAMDVTTPTASSEANAATKVAWEFPLASTGGVISTTRPIGSSTTGDITMNINKIGYTFGRPVIVKTKAHGWVALVTSGYNNGTDTAGDGTGGTGGDGHGYLFVLDVRTGALLHVFDTEAGTGANPSGLVHISAFVQSPTTNNTVQYVYGGDLLGNVWRFDLNDLSTSQWKLQKLTVLLDASNNLQPVTTEPELATVQLSSGTTRMVYVGTGQYLGIKDVPGVSGANASATTTQSLYALVDDLKTLAAHTSPVRANMQQRVLTLSGGATCATATTSTTRSTGTSPTPVNFASQLGWYVDLPCTGERINTAPVLAQGVIYFTSNIPNNDPCSPGGSSWSNALDFKDGYDATPLTTTTKVASEFLGNVLGSRPILIQLPDGSVKVLIRTSDANTITKTGKNPGATNALRRQTWKEIKRY